MIRHLTVYPDRETPPPRGVFYQYLLGANGTFLEAARPGLAVCVSVGQHQPPVRGLAEVRPYFHFTRVPAAFLARMLAEARAQAPYETLFYLSQEEGVWQAQLPEQTQTLRSVVPVDRLDPAYRGALVEVHSHPPGPTSPAPTTTPSSSSGSTSSWAKSHSLGPRSRSGSASTDSSLRCPRGRCLRSQMRLSNRRRLQNSRRDRHES